MIRNLFLVVALLWFCGCTPLPVHIKVTVENPLGIERTDEMVEIPLEDITSRLNLGANDKVVVTNSIGEEVPSQITSDGKFIFPISVTANGSSLYKVFVGEPSEVTTAAYGRCYPERVDDIAWENDKVAFRTYGPALQASGERAFGYDVWVKNCPEMVVENRYDMELNQGISYHVDHGNGLDCYKVGPTLGGGAAALLDAEGNIIYPYCYASYEITDNGPLRFQVKMTYNPLVVNGDSAVVENRLLTLDKGSHLNRMVISYTGLTVSTPIITGIVIHPENPEAYVADASAGYIAYQDLTDNVNADNGEIYVGAVMAAPVAEAKAMLFGAEESATLRGGATGNVVAVSAYEPDSEYVYYWGNGWSKAGIENMETWTNYLQTYAQKVRNPLVITLE